MPLYPCICNTTRIFGVNVTKLPAFRIRSSRDATANKPSPAIFNYGMKISHNNTDLLKPKDQTVLWVFNKFINFITISRHQVYLVISQYICCGFMCIKPITIDYDRYLYLALSCQCDDLLCNCNCWSASPQTLNTNVI